MALQAGLPPLDFSPLAVRGRRGYIVSIHAAMNHDYTPLTAKFERVIERSRRRAASIPGIESQPATVGQKCQILRAGLRWAGSKD
jgi:hypothetical protein